MSGRPREPRAPSPMDETFLSAYVDGELDATTRAAVEAQVAASPAWQAELADVEAMRDAVRSLGDVEAPPGFWDRVLAPEDATVVPLADARRRRPRNVRWGALAGAAAAAAVLGIVLVPRPAPVRPELGTLTASHAERASLGNDVVVNLAGTVVPTGIAR